MISINSPRPSGISDHTSESCLSRKAIILLKIIAFGVFVPKEETHVENCVPLPEQKKSQEQKPGKRGEHSKEETLKE